MPNVKWKSIPPVRGPDYQGLVDKGVISNKVKLKVLRELNKYIAKTDVEKIIKN